MMLNRRANLFGTIGLCTLAFAFQAHAEVGASYRCTGYTSANVQTADIEISVEPQGSHYKMDLVFKGVNSTMPVERKALKPGGVSFFETFFNRIEDVQLKVFLDDVGATSSLEYKGEQFFVTCGESF